MFDIREEIIRAFKRGIFPYIDEFKADEESDEKSDEELDENKFFKDIQNESKSINYDSFKAHFSVIAPTVLAKELFETKGKKKKSELRDLENEIEKMSEDEKDIEKPNKIVNIVE